jgi:hypothetical protein
MTTRAASFGTVRMRHDLTARSSVIEDTEDVESVSTEMDLRMFAYCGGRERSLDRLTDLACEAALAFGTGTSARHRSIVEFLPDQTVPQTS